MKFETVSESAINAIVYVLSFENVTVSVLSIVLVTAAIAHVLLSFFSEKYRNKSTREKSWFNGYLVGPSLDHLKLAATGFAIILAVIVVLNLLGI